MIDHHPNFFSHRDTEAIIRLLNLDIVQKGLDAETYRNWHYQKCPFPHLRYEPVVLSMAKEVERLLPESGLHLCDPQFIYHLPDEAREWPKMPHTDVAPLWADSPLKYIAAVPLSDWTPYNGGLSVWLDEPNEIIDSAEVDEKTFDQNPHDLYLYSGDVFIFTPDVQHCGNLNRMGSVRMGVYFRWF